MMIKQKIKKSILWTFLLIVTLPLLSLYVWLLFNSINGKPLYSLLPDQISFRTWTQLFSTLPNVTGMPNSVLPILKNTLIVAVGVMIVNLITCSAAGYAVSKLKFKWKEGLLSSLLIVKAFPVLILLIATYFVLYYLHILNTFLAVILTRSSMELVMGTWIIKGFFDSVPLELEDAARIDGATRFQLWSKIMIPLVKPGLIAVGIMAFIGGWSDFIFVYTFIFDQSKWTLSVFLYGLIASQESVDYNFLSTVSLFYMLPTVMLYGFAQKGLTQGVLGGSIK